MTSPHFRILLVEDDEDDYIIIRDLLSEINGRDFHLEWKTSYDDALKAMRQNQHDVYLVDFRLGARSGLELLREAIQCGCYAPIILLTGQGDRKVDIEAMKAGAADYMEKIEITGSLLERSIRYAIERHQLQGKLKASERRLGTIIANNADGIIIMNKHKIIDFVNPAAESLFSCKAENLIGKLFEYPVSPGETKEIDINQDDGKTIIAEMAVTKIEWNSENAYLASLHNITERKRAEEELLQSKEKTRALLNATSDMVYLIDKEGSISALNETSARNFEKRQDELIGINIYTVFPSHHAKQIKMHADEVIRSGEPVYFEDEFAGRLQLITLYPVFARQGNVVQLAINSRDITRTKLLQDQLIRSERLAATGQLAASIAHEINSPLQAITVMLSMIKKKHEGDKALLENIDILKGAFGSIRDTVKNLLDLNRPGKDAKQLTDINLVINKTVTLAQSYLKTNKVSLILDLPSRIPTVTASPQQLNQLFLNLITNAVEAISVESKSKDEKKKLNSKSNEITIKTNFKKENIVIKVSDTGPGISKEDLNHIFDPFYSRKKKMGIGIGLSICHGIIEDHHGTIVAENSPGGGTTFTITLPVKQ